jgi:A nuclease of the HNH/ENDO VII superfamily with conserved LHH
VSILLCEYLNTTKDLFEVVNFDTYLPDFGGFFCNKVDADKIFRIKDWLRIFIPVDEKIFGSVGEAYVQEIMFPMPTKSFGNKKDINEFLKFCYYGSFKGIRPFFNFLSMEFHHVDQKQEKIVYVPKDFHKGYHNLLHPDKNQQQPLPKLQRKRYEKNRKTFLKFIGDSILCYLIHRGEIIGNTIKESYMLDKQLEKFVYEYQIINIQDQREHQFIYYPFDNAF